MGFAREERAFSPHLTLGRVKSAVRGTELSFQSLSPKDAVERVQAEEGPVIESDIPDNPAVPDTDEAEVSRARAPHLAGLHRSGV